MKTNTRIAIAALLSAAGAALNAFAAELNGSGGEAQPTASPETPAAEKPVKAPKAPKAPKETVQPETPVTPAEPETPAEPAEEATGKTYEELKAAIEPIIKAGQGAEVKKLIAKYDPDAATPSIRTMPAKNHEAFLKDLAPLSY